VVVKGGEGRARPTALSPPGAIGYALLTPPGAGPGDFVVRHASGRHRTLPGVYRVEGDVLTVCLALRGGRPSGCRAGSTFVVYTFERVGDPEV